MEPLPWILAGTGAGGIVTAIATAFGVNKSRKTDAAKDREQRDRIADEDREQRDRIADEDRKQRDRIADEDRKQRDRIADEDRKQRAADAAAEREDRKADREDRKADREQRAAEAADARQGTQAIMASLERQGKALEEIIRRTSPPSPPGVAEDKPDTTVSPNPDPGQDGADSMGADRAAGLAARTRTSPSCLP